MCDFFQSLVLTIGGLSLYSISMSNSHQYDSLKNILRSWGKLGNCLPRCSFEVRNWFDVGYFSVFVHSVKLHNFPLSKKITFPVQKPLTMNGSLSYPKSRVTFMMESDSTMIVIYKRILPYRDFFLESIFLVSNISFWSV